MLVFTQFKRINIIIFKNWIYYVAHNDTKYYLIASYLLGKPTNSRTRQKIFKKTLMKCIKYKMDQELR